MSGRCPTASHAAYKQGMMRLEKCPLDTTVKGLLVTLTGGGGDRLTEGRTRKSRKREVRKRKHGTFLWRNPSVEESGENETRASQGTE